MCLVVGKEKGAGKEETMPQSHHRPKPTGGGEKQRGDQTREEKL